MFKNLSQPIYLGHKPLGQVVPDLPELLANPEKFLAAREVRIGPGRRLGGCAIALCGGCLGLLLAMLRDKRFHGGEINFFVLLLAVGFVVGLVLSLRRARQELILRADGVEFAYGNTAVCCPWALFNAPGYALFLDFEGWLTLPIAAEAVPAVEMRRHGVCTAQGYDVRSRHWKFLEHDQVRFSGRFAPFPKELGGLLLHLGRTLGSRSPAAATSAKRQSQPEPSATAPLSRSRGGWITVPLTHIHFPPQCCGCDAPTSQRVQLEAKEQFAFPAHGSRSAKLSVPLCPSCQRRIRRENLLGLALGLAGLLLLVLLGVTGVIAGWLVFPLALLFGLVGYRLFRLLVLRNRPAHVRRFSVRAQTIQIRFRRPEYAERFLAFQANQDRFRRPADVETAYRETLKIHAQLARDFPAVPQYRHDLATSQLSLGNLLYADRNRRGEAEAAYRESQKLSAQLVQEFPAVPQYRQNLALSQNNLGLLYADQGKWVEAETAYREALRIQRQLVEDFGTVPAYHNDLAATMGNQANVLWQNNQLDEARPLLEEALPHHQAALQAEPGNLEFRTVFRNNRGNLMQILVALGEPAAAAEAARQLTQAAIDPAIDFYKAACILARCVPLAERDSELSEGRKERAQVYAEQALAALRQAVQHGMRDAAYLKNDTDLDPLHAHPEFQELLRELEAKPKAERK